MLTNRFFTFYKSKDMPDTCICAFVLLLLFNYNKEKKKKKKIYFTVNGDSGDNDDIVNKVMLIISIVVNSHTNEYIFYSF